ncbi:MAG TPA: ElyC/SanA/YdcF family protein [Albitalea sp.]
MNSLFAALGIESWKPLLTALILPPVPFLLLILVGARLLPPRRAWGWTLIVLSVAGLWLGTCTGTARALEQFVLRLPPPLKAERIAQIKARARAADSTAIVVLGGGTEPFAPEYGMSNLGFYSLERLRYGLWLGRETGVPVGFSGGLGWAAAQATTEAEVASRIAEREFNRPLRWIEDRSRDTRQNAAHSVALLKQSGIRHIVLVTHGWHMPRARRAFEEAAAPHGISVEAAPMGLAQRIEAPALDWLPSGTGMLRVRNALRESLGRLLGA